MIGTHPPLRRPSRLLASRASGRGDRALIAAGRTLAAFLAWASFAGGALAQSRVVEEVLVEQSRIVERFSPPPVKGSASLRVPDVVEPIPAELAARGGFVLRAVRVEGATALGEPELRPLWENMIGRLTEVSDLVELTDRMESRYRQSGILAVAVVPVQDFSGGEARIVVFDRSFIQTIETRGDHPGLRDRLDPYIRRLVALQPLRLAEVERILLLMSDMAGLNIEASLRRPEQPGNGGALTLDIAFQKRVVRVSLDDRGTDEVGPVQAFATYQENDLLGLLESTTLTGVTIPNQPRELLFGQLAQDFPVGSNGLHVGYRLGATRSEPGGDLADLDLQVASLSGELYASYAVLRTIDHSVFGRIGLATRDTDVDVPGQRLSRDRYRWLTLGVAAEHETGIGPLAVQAEYLHGLDAFDATDEGASQASRSAAEPDFRILRGGATLTLPLSGWLTAIGRLEGQYAFGALPADVQMSFGGDPFGRAFDSGAASGDSGIMGGIEVEAATGAPFDGVLGTAVYGFADHGAFWFQGDDRPDTRETLGSVGAGARASLEAGLLVEATLAVPIEYGSGGEDTGARVFLAVRKRF